MNAIIKLVTNPLLISIIGLIALAIVIWFGGPMIGINDKKPLATEVNRLLAILIITVLWGLNNFRVQHQKNKKDTKMMGAIVDMEDPYQQSASDEEAKVLQDRFNEALQILKKNKKTHSSHHHKLPLHELPLYIIIGPPGSGKTTALINSGLKFPLAKKMGQQPLEGIGGTRNCDWWFSDEAILLDTAGRYTTQDSDQYADRAAWSKFLQLLRTHRPIQPINGAIVAISLAELMRQSEAERQQHGRTIRLRLQELYEDLGIRFPIYVLFTKTDLVAGFSEFFDNLARTERQQIWGMTFPLSDDFDSQFDIDLFNAEYDELLRQLNGRMQWRIHEERDPGRRARILGFSVEFSALKKITGRFLDALFQPSRYEQSVTVRGVYFTSGTQEGTPFDRVLSTMAGTFGLDNQQVPVYSGQGKSFFLTHLFSDVVFPEAVIAGTNLSRQRFHAWVGRSAFVAAFVVTVSLALVWTTQYTYVSAQITSINDNINDYVKVSKRFSSNAADPAAMLPTLVALTAARVNASQDNSVFSHAGLSQVGKLQPASEMAYFRTLEMQFFPRLVTTIETVLIDSEISLDNRLMSLKTYLMLAQPGRFDLVTVRNWFEQYWLAQFPGDKEKQDHLLHHFDKLMARGFNPINLDQNIVADSRLQLQKIPLAQRIYSSIKQQAERMVPGFFLTEIFDREAQQIYVNKTNADQPLPGIPGLYTKQGYESVFLEQSVNLTKVSLKDDWVLGTNDDTRAMDSNVLQKDLNAFYVRDFIKYWNHLFNAIKLASFKNFQHAVDVLENLAGPDSSLFKLLESLKTHTDLRGKVSELKQLGNLLGTSTQLGRKAAKKITIDTDAPLTPVGEKIQKHFAKLIAQTEAKKSAPPALNQQLQLLISLQDYLNEMAAATDSNVMALQKSKERLSSNGKDIIGKIRRQAIRQPKPIDKWTLGLADSAWRLMLRTSRQQINRQWKNEVVTLYEENLNRRYPFFKQSVDQVSIQSFNDFFSPNGVYRRFIKENIDPFIKKNVRSWTLKTLDNRNIGFTRKVLKQLQRGDQIGHAFFPKSSEEAVMKFQFKPRKLNQSIKKATFMINDYTLTYQHGPTVFTKLLVWPSDDPERSFASIRFDDAETKRVIRKKGAWSLFQLLDVSEIKAIKRSKERFNVIFTLGGRSVKYELKAKESSNPFSITSIHLFRCPTQL